MTTINTNIQTRSKRYSGKVDQHVNMEAFDQLPPELRKFVNEFQFNLNPVTVLKAYEHYKDVEKIRSMIHAIAVREVI
jgi:hypothetical protein